MGGDAELVDERHSRWAEVVADGDPQAFRTVLSTRGLDEMRAREGLREMRPLPGADPPAWVETLAELLSSDDPLVPAQARLRASARGHNELLPGLVAGFERQVRALLAPGRGLPPLAGSATYARAVATLLDGCCESASLLTERLERDASALAGLTGAEPVVTGIVPDAGDRHHGGSVARLDLLDGTRVFYKPRDLAASDALEALIRELGLQLALPRRLSRAGYGWELAAEPRAPAGAGEWDSLARDVGAWLRLLTLLGAGDLADENLVVAGPQLVPIDHEVLFPFPVWPDDAGVVHPALATGLISSPTLGMRGATRSDRGLLAASDMAPLSDRTAEIATGYSEAHAALFKRRETAELAIDRLAATPVRGLVRGTWVYDHLLRQSLTGRAASGGVERSLVLERLWRAHRRSGLDPGIVAAEVGALERVEIPSFSFRAGTCDVDLPEGRVARGVFGQAPVEPARAALRELQPRPDGDEIEAIGALVFCARPEAASRYRMPVADRDVPDWRAEATRAAEELLAVLDGASGRPFTVTYIGSPPRFLLTELAGDLISGAGGIAVVLQELGTRVADPRFCGAAAALVASVEEHCQLALEDPGGPGANLGGALYALSRLRAAGVTRASTALDQVGAAVAAIQPERIWPTGSVDQLAELLLGLAAASAGTDDMRGSLLALVAERWPDEPPALPLQPLARVMPSARGLAALALARASADGVGHPLVTGWLETVAPEGAGDIAVQAALSARPGVAPPSESSLDHVAAIEESLMAGQRSEAETHGRALLARRRREGRWYGESPLADRHRLSGVWGLAAVAHALGSLAGEAPIPSLRLYGAPYPGGLGSP